MFIFIYLLFIFKKLQTDIYCLNFHEIDMHNFFLILLINEFLCYNCMYFIIICEMMNNIIVEL